MGNFNFGNYICELREKKGMSQSELGAKLGVTNKAVSKWENGGGYPSTELMLPLAKELGVTIEELYKAVSESKNERKGIALFWERIMKKSKLISVILFLLALTPYLVFLIFSNTDTAIKNELLIMTPIVCVIIYFMFLLIFFLMSKNPFASNKILDFSAVFFVGAMTLSYVTLIIEYFMFFPNTYYFTLSAVPSAIAAVINATKKRYK